MTHDDLIRRMDAMKALDWGDIYGRNAQDAIASVPSASEGAVKKLIIGPDVSCRYFLYLRCNGHDASFDLGVPKGMTNTALLMAARDGKTPPNTSALTKARDALQAIADLNSISAIEFARKYPELDKALGKDIEMWGEVLSDFASDVLKETVE